MKNLAWWQTGSGYTALINGDSWLMTILIWKLAVDACMKWWGFIQPLRSTTKLNGMQMGPSSYIGNGKSKTRYMQSICRKEWWCCTIKKKMLNVILTRTVDLNLLGVFPQLVSVVCGLWWHLRPCNASLWISSINVLWSFCWFLRHSTARHFD